jgi:hypothetical protein
MSRWNSEHKLQQIIYLDESLQRKLKAYAIETGRTFLELIEPELSAFEQALINKSVEIDSIRFKALEEMRKSQEEQKIALENPIKVTGKPEDPIGNILLEEPISS